MRTLLDPLLRFNSLVGSTAQCERSNVPTAQFCQSIGCSPMFSPRGVLERDLWGRRTGSPSYSAYDGLPVRRPRRTARTTDFQSVGQGAQVDQWARRTGSPSYKAIKTPGPVVTTTGRGCVSPPGLMNANLLGSISLYCMSGHVWPLQSNSLKRGRPPQPPRPLLPRPKPRWRRGAKRLDGADVRCEV